MSESHKNTSPTNKGKQSSTTSHPKQTNDKQQSSIDYSQITTSQGNFDPEYILQLQRTLGNQFVINNVLNRDQNKPKSETPNIKPAHTTKNQTVIQSKAVDEGGRALTIDDLRVAFAGTDYEQKFETALASQLTHMHHVKNEEKAQDALKNANTDNKSRIKAWDNLARAKGDEKIETYNWLKRALSPDNPMFFTIQDIKDYLDGKPIPGISNLEAKDIKGANDEVLPINPATGEQWDADEFNELADPQKAQARAKTIVSTLERMKENREAYGKRAEGVNDKGELPNTADDEMKLLAETFKNTTFFYGTTGETANHAKFKKLFAKVKKAKKKRLGNKVGSYSAGIRNMGFMKAIAGGERHRMADTGENTQMMDMYYGGQELETWHMMAHPVIGRYVHEMMGYAGEYKHSESMDTTFRKNFPLGGDSQNWENRGWSDNAKPEFAEQEDQPDRPENEALLDNVPPEWQKDMSASMEISRIIREAVHTFGGTIVFEGSEVTNQSHFVPECHGDMRDTNREAIELLPSLANNPGSSRAPFGAGQVIFHWMGKETQPTRELFLKHWAYATPAEENEAERVVVYQKGKRTIIDNPLPWFWSFPGNRQQAMRLALDKYKRDNPHLLSNAKKKDGEDE